MCCVIDVPLMIHNSASMLQDSSSLLISILFYLLIYLCIHNVFCLYRWISPAKRRSILHFRCVQAIYSALNELCWSVLYIHVGNSSRNFPKSNADEWNDDSWNEYPAWYALLHSTYIKCICSSKALRRELQFARFIKRSGFSTCKSFHVLY